MTFHDFDPWRVSKILLPTRGFVTAGFYCKVLRESKKRVVRAPENIKIIQKRKETQEKWDTQKSLNSIRPMTLLNGEFQVSQNIYKTNIKFIKTLILDRPKH